MADSKDQDNNNSSGWMSVPAFGEWDMKNGVPDYSMDFTKIREMRKQNKNPSRASLGNDDELLHNNKLRYDNNSNNKEEEPPHHRDPVPDLHHNHGSPTGRKKFMGYFQCCIGA